MRSGGLSYAFVEIATTLLLLNQLFSTRDEMLSIAERIEQARRSALEPCRSHLCPLACT